MSILNDMNFYKGMVFVIILTLLSYLIVQIRLVEQLHFSVLIVAILIGMIVSNSFKIDLDKYSLALNFCTKQLLRFAIVLYGFRLTLDELFVVGFDGFLYSFIVVSSTFILGYFIGVKILKLDNHIAILTSAGSAICGAAAVLATEAILKNRAYQTSIAVSTVVLFGTISMFSYPYLYEINILNLSDKQMALYVGGTLHEVAHVVAAGNTLHNDTIANNAVVVKMLRVMLLAPFLLLVAIFFMNKEETTKKVKITIPWFAILFIVMIGINSLNLFSSRVIDSLNLFDTFLLAVAMLALGLKTDFKSIKKAGAKPLLLATILFLWLFVGGYILTLAI